MTERPLSFGNRQTRNHLDYRDVTDHWDAFALAKNFLQWRR